MDADAIEIRVLGCLIEKERTTPDVYPLTLNGLRSACNQTTNRDPVVSYEEREIHEALRRLAQRGWARLTSGPGSRAVKYRHLLGGALDVDHAEVALLAVLMLRGAQTPGELKQRTERLHAFASLTDVEEALERLAERELVARLPRQPGQKEERYNQLLGADGADPEAGAETATRAVPSPVPPAGNSSLEARVAQLEAETAELRAELAALKADLGA
jgi:hypothetical protein